MGCFNSRGYISSKDKINNDTQQLKSQDKFYKLTKKQLMQKLDCPICLVDFNLALNIPMMICLRQHNICKYCLESLPLFKNDFKCPLCAEPCKKQFILVNRLLQLMLEQERLDDHIQANQIQIEHFYQLKNKSIQSLIKVNQRPISKIQKQKSQYNILEKQGGDSDKIQSKIQISSTNNILVVYQQYKQQYIINKNQKLSRIQLQKSHRDLRSYQRQLIQSQIDNLVNLSIQNQKISFQKGNAKLQSIPSRLDINLMVVSLDHNLIKHITGLDHLNCLKLLSLNYNLIQKIENLDGLLKLKMLFLMSNKIQLVQNLQNLSYLLQVDLRGNKINKKSKQNRKALFQLKDRQVFIDL